MIREEINQSLLPILNWQATIEEAVPDVKIYGIVPEEPKLELLGAYRPTSQQKKAASSLRRGIAINELHAMLVEAPNLQQLPVSLQADTLDYALLEVLRRTQQQRPIVSTSALIVCPDARVLLLQLRSKNSRTFPDCLHTVGGAYQPASAGGGRDSDTLSLRSSALREVWEETNIGLSCTSSPLMLLAEERSTRFFQFVLLGVAISPEQLASCKANWESASLVKLPFDELPSFLESPRRPWVPSGKAHLLAWLAHDAPGAGYQPMFDKLSPQALFNDLVPPGPK